MKIARKCQNHKTQPSHGTKRRGDEEQTMTEQMPHMKPPMTKQRRTGAEKPYLLLLTLISCCSTSSAAAQPYIPLLNFFSCCSALFLAAQPYFLLLSLISCCLFPTAQSYFMLLNLISCCSTLFLPAQPYLLLLNLISWCNFWHQVQLDFRHHCHLWVGYKSP